MRALLILPLIATLAVAQIANIQRLDDAVQLRWTDAPAISLAEWTADLAAPAWQPYTLAANLRNSQPLPVLELTALIEHERYFWRLSEWCIVEQTTNRIVLIRME